MASVEERLKKIIAEQLGVERNEIVPSSSFIEDFNADSLDLVELKMSIEDEFHIKIPDEEMEQVITTFQEALRYVEKRLR
jgi:acyl carrier protein